MAAKTTKRAGKQQDDSLNDFSIVEDGQGGDGHRAILLSLPLADPPANESQYAKIEVRLTKSEKDAFMQLRSGLRKVRAELAGGRPVWSSADVVRWLAQKIKTARPDNPNNPNPD